MRIGIDARFFGGEQSKGLGRYAQKLIEYLMELDQDNQYVIFLQSPQYDSITLPKHWEKVRADFRWYTLKEQLFLPRLIKRAHVDLMHFPHFNVPLFLRVPFVVTIHDLIISHFPTERATTLGPLLYSFKQYAYQLVIKHAAKASHRIITVSEFSKQDIVDTLQVAPEKIDVTYEAAEPLGASCDPVRAKEFLNQHKIAHDFILYVGNAYPHKNLETLLDTATELKKQHLPWSIVMVGRPDYFYDKLQMEAERRQVADRVIFPGFVSDADLSCLYSKALCYVFPSKYEGFGLPPLEAMLYDCPVVAARTSCIPEILGEAARYFDSGDVSGIISNVEHIRTDATERQQLAQAGRAQAAKYSWRKLAQQTQLIYQNLGLSLKTKSPGPTQPSA